MTIDRLATEAVRKAISLRSDLGIGPSDSICPIDLADRIGVVVRLEALPSVEGLYIPGFNPTVILSVERPTGRRRHTCSHELGHHMFGHGFRLDELTNQADERWRPEEYLADRFAAGLLMPKLAVESAIVRRGWQASKLTTAQVFVVAQDLGVGYRNLVRHLERTLQIVSSKHASQLRFAAARLPHLRMSLAGFTVTHDLIVADEHWGTRPIDMEVGDVVIFPDTRSFLGACLSLETNPTPHFRASVAGKGSITLAPGRTPTKVRVSPRGFTGLARYRHLENPDHES